MSSRIPDTHAEAWALLPWLANGRISAEDREWVEAHVQGCAECRAELASQRLVASQVTRDVASSPPTTASEEQQSFNKLWARIEAGESASKTATGTTGAAMPVARTSRTVRWLAAAVVVQALGLGVLGLALRNAPGDGRQFRDRHQSGAASECACGPPGVRAERADRHGQHAAHAPGTVDRVRPWNAGNFTAELSTDAVASGASAESVAAVMAKDPQCHFRAAHRQVV